MSVSTAATILGASWRGQDTRFDGCGIDSRCIARGALFIALRGERGDGHDFVAHAAQRGAAAALISRPDAGGLPVIEVADTLEAMARLAGAWRDGFRIPVIGVTGSVGKTTVKEMLAAIYGGDALATRGNLNNEIGAPLTVLRLGKEHRVAIVEMGANHPGEVARIAAMARPTVGLITRCGAAHLAGFGDVAGVARAKGELLAALAPDGVAVINADDAQAPLLYEMAAGRTVVSFALEAAAAVRAHWRPAAAGGRVRIETPLGTVTARLRLAGRHNAANAAAAVAAAVAAGGVDVAAIVHGLESVRPIAGRLRVLRGPHGATLIDDSYNANPVSLEAALKSLASYPEPRWLVFGDMAELGAGARAAHAAAGEAACRYGVERLYAIGEMSALTVRRFGAGGAHFATVEQLIAALERDLRGAATVLVKGSRAARMEQVVAALTRSRPEAVH